MTQSLHLAAQTGFSSAAELYQSVRPSYPPQVIDWLRQQLQLSGRSQVIDLGAGTGKFLPYLQAITEHILAIEPIEAMLAQLHQAYPTVKTLQACSDALPVSPHFADAVICAQAFHWFANIDSLTQMHRVLKPSGHLGLIWNQRDTQVDWVKALDDLIQPLEGDTPRYHTQQWQNVFQQQSLFQLENVQTFPQQHIGTVEQVVSKRLLSTSFIAALPKAQQQQLKIQFEQLVFAYTQKQPQDEIAFPYITIAYDFKKINQK